MSINRVRLRLEAMTAEEWVSLVGEVKGGGEFSELLGIVQEGQLPSDR